MKKPKPEIRESPLRAAVVMPLAFVAIFTLILPLLVIIKVCHQSRQFHLRKPASPRQ